MAKRKNYDLPATRKKEDESRINEFWDEGYACYYGSDDYDYETCEGTEQDYGRRLVDGFNMLGWN